MLYGNDNNEDDDSKEDDSKNKGNFYEENFTTRHNDERWLGHKNEHTNYPKRYNFSLLLRDIEDSIRTFDCSDTYPVEQWIFALEDTAVLFKCNGMQKLIILKWSLKEITDMYIQSEGVVKS